MTREIVPLQPEWLAELGQFLRAGSGAPADAESTDPEVLRWKYFDADGYDDGPRSLVARENGQIVGHVGFCRTAFVVGDPPQEVSTLHMIDWLARASDAPVGAMLMLQAFRHAQTQFSLGGTLQGRQVAKRVGYKLIVRVPVFCKILHADYRRRMSPQGPLWKHALRVARDYGRKARYRESMPKVPVDLRRVESFGAEVDTVVEAGRMKSIHTCRRPHLLNHLLRYPSKGVSGWHLLQRNQIRGFALLNRRQHANAKVGKIADLFLDSQDPALCHAAVHALAQELRSQGADLVDCFASTPWLLQSLADNGFFQNHTTEFCLRDPRNLLPANSTFYLTRLEADHAYR